MIEKYKERNKIVFSLALVIMPLVVGGVIYILFRRRSLVMFSWIDYIGLDEEVNTFRSFFLPIKEYLPNWVIYSLPNALWAFSMLSFFALLWKHDRPFYYFWIITVVGFSLCMELLQLGGLIPGTFSADDLILLSFTYIIFWIIFRQWF